MFLGFCNKQAQFYKNKGHLWFSNEWIALYHHDMNTSAEIKEFYGFIHGFIVFVIMEKLKVVLRAQMELVALFLFNKYINLIYLYIFL